MAKGGVAMDDKGMIDLRIDELRLPLMPYASSSDIDPCELRGPQASTAPWFIGLAVC
jgi:hypothetical protein